MEKAWRIERLTAANHAYTEMLGFVSHELKNPLASMVMDARILTGGYLGSMDPRHVEVVERMARKSGYLLGLLREYLDLARIESGELAVSIGPDVDLIGDVIEPAVEIVRSDIEEHGSRLTRDLPAGSFPVRCDPDLLKIVLVNLLGNAAKYGNPDGEIRVSARRDPGSFSVSVWNEGPGFPESEKHRHDPGPAPLQTLTPCCHEQRGRGAEEQRRKGNRARLSHLSPPAPLPPCSFRTFERF